MYTKFISTAIILILLTLAGFAAWTLSEKSISDLTSDFTDTQTPQSNETEITFAEAVEALYTGDPTSNFNKGYQAELRQNYSEAVDFYRAALPEAKNPTESAHIKYRLARALEYTDTPASIRMFKEVADDPTYPATQKQYAVMWIPVTILRTIDDNPRVLEEALVGEPYSSFKKDELSDTLTKFYEYSLTFGSTGVADFAVAQSLAEAIRDKEITDPEEIESTKERIAALMSQGRGYITTVRTDPRNAGLLPRIYRAQAQTNAIVAQLGDEYALTSFDVLFIEAITQGLASKLDGAVRWDYFRHAYDTFGEASFVKTQPHLNFLLSNLNTYEGIRNYFISERENRYGTKSDVVKYANANATLKSKLIELGWTEADFQE